MPDPTEHKHAIWLDQQAKKQARDELQKFRTQRRELRRALDEIEQHFHTLPPKGR